MTKEEALEILKTEMKFDNGNTIYLAYYHAIEALEKQIPQKPITVPIDDEFIYKGYECPNCGNRIIKYNENYYCFDCGQLLKMEDGK